mmetsp:Transcript_2652/g.5294  ORF Transcript_2652/g.5294 Transcript_2652/m.5294 type:complete len:382 (+) Transcript_2652:519-1664(+)
MRVDLLDAGCELLALLQEPRVVRVELRRQEEVHSVPLGGLVDLLQLLFLHRKPAQGLLLHAGLVDLGGVVEAEAQLVLDDRGPRGVDGGHPAAVDGLAVLRRQGHEHGPGDVAPPQPLGLQRAVDAGDEGLDLAAELRPQGLVGHALDLPEVRLAVAGPRQGHAAPLHEELADGLAQPVLLVLPGRRPEGALEVAALAQRGAGLVQGLEVEVAQGPDEAGEVLGELQHRGRVGALLGALVEVPREVQHEVQVVDGLLVDGADGVVDEAGGEEDAEGEDLHVAAGRALRGAQALRVDEDAVEVRLYLHGLAPDPEALGAGVHGGADLEAVLQPQQPVEQEGLPCAVEPRDAHDGQAPLDLEEERGRVRLDMAGPPLINPNKL